MIAAAVPHVASRPAAHRGRRRWRPPAASVSLAVAGILLGAAPAPAAVADPGCYDGADRCQSVNDYRADHGRPPLDQRWDLQQSAKKWAGILATSGTLRHSGAPVEVVGYAPDWLTVMAAWDLSSCLTTDEPCPGHKEILLDRGLTQLGIGRARDDTGRLWAVIQFR